MSLLGSEEPRELVFESRIDYIPKAKVKSSF